MSKLTRDGAERLLEQFRLVLHRAAMRSEWDVAFAGDMVDRLTQFGASTRISAKQWDQIDGLLERRDETLDADDVVNPYP